jgi:DNA-binding HxlR family transcriptional regulator
MLTQTLRQLEGEGVVTRTIYPTVPPTVEYALTPQGKSFVELFLSMAATDSEPVEE